MKASTRALDRILVGLVGLMLLAAGAWLVAYRTGIHPTLTTAAQRVDPRVIASAPDQPWWEAEVGVIGLALVLVAVWLLVRHLHGSAAGTVPAGDGGTADLARIGEAVASDLARHPAVRRAKPKVLVEKGKPVIRVSVSVPPDADPEDLARLARAAQREVARATNPDVRLQILVKTERPRGRATRPHTDLGT